MIKLYQHCLADVDYFPPWSHANNTTHWGISVTLSRHTVPTWLLVTSVRGTRIFEHVTSFKTAKGCHSTHSKIQQMGNTTRREPHSTGMTADRPGVNCSCTPLLFLFSCTVQSSRGGRACEAEEPTNEAFWPEMFKAKAHTQDSLRTKEQQLWGFSSTAGARVCGIFHCTLNWLLYTWIIHPHFKQAREQDKGNAMQQLTSTVHRRIIYCFYVVWTAKLCHDCEKHSVSCTPVMSEKKFMAKEVKLHLRARWATRLNSLCCLATF